MRDLYNVIDGYIKAGVKKMSDSLADEDWEDLIYGLKK